MPNYNEILDEQRKPEIYLPKVDPFEEGWSDRRKRIGKVAAIVMSVVFVISIFVMLLNEHKDVVATIVGFIATFMMLGALFVVGVILSGIVNFVVLIIGKLLIEPTRNRKIIRYYQYVYLDVHLGFSIVIALFLWGMFLRT